MRIVPRLCLLVLAGCLPPIEVATDTSADASIAPLPDAADPNAARRLFETWSGCMTLANFQTAGMATAWGSLAGNDGRVCSNCHDSGAFGFIATRDEEALFSALSKHSSLLAMYFRADLTSKTVVVNTYAFVNADRKPGHPRFNAEDNAGMTALRTFHSATVANTACGSPTLVD
jgi:hypothetical protein